MRAATSDPLAVLTRMIGQHLVSVEQAFYVFAGAVDTSASLLQLRSEDGLVVHLWTGADGDSVRIVGEPWEDPFAEPLSDENRAFVAKSGKWTLFDVSTTPAMAPLVGRVIQSVSALRDEYGTLRGVRFEVGTELLTYVVDADEGFVLHGLASDALRDLGLSVDTSMPP